MTAPARRLARIERADRRPVPAAEQQLVEMIAAEGGPDFTVTITRADGRWTVSTEDHDAVGSSTRTGQGATFDEAWGRHALAPGLHR